MRKLLKYRTEDGQLIRVLYTNGVCRTPEALEKVFNSNVSWEGISTSGDTTPMPNLKFVSKKMDADNPEFLGLQNPPKVQPKPVEMDKNGTEKPKRGRKPSNITPEIVEKMKDLASTMTLKQAEKELGISYANLFNTAKKNGIEFVKGQRGRKKKETIDKPAKV